MFYAINSNLRSFNINQKIFSSESKISSFKFLSKLKKFDNVLVITGKFSFEISGSKKLVEETLSNSKITIFNDFNVNPDIDEIKYGYAVAKRVKPDAILAIGGGSVIDAAKILHLMYSSNIDDDQIFKADEKDMYQSRKNIPLIAIPTTAGTGSESTHFAVLYKNEKKYSIASSKMLPEIVYLDPNLCLSNSSYQNACSGFDALSQAIESFWSKKSNFISRYYSLKSIKIIIENFENAVHSSNNYQNLSKMLIASNYAGKAINITKTTGPHAISYGITKGMGLPHGHAVAVTLGAFFKLHNQLLKTHRNELKLFKKVSSYIENKTNKNSSSFLYGLMKKFDMEFDIEDLGLDQNKIDSLIDNINLERMSNHPVNLDKQQLNTVFKNIPKKIDQIY
tara:strand:- start:3708 stop:4892 length:1185 start_codon:yes stop_codon:yes gene_type:complete